MSPLPPALAPWADALALLAPELAGALAPLARTLDVLVGRVRARPRPLGDDPEGYDGIDRRGPYDRLLLSEWALADALPEEFDRRAVAGEHAFLRLDRRDRAGAPRVVALFDGGPENLGGPRVVQLVALVVLARRAAAAGGALTWGALPGGALHTTVDRVTLEAFLAGRSGRPAHAGDAAAALAHAGAHDELWIVGATNPLVVPAPGSTAPSPPPRALHLALADVVAPDAHAIDALLTRGAERLGEARLALPPPALCRRVLADPFPASAGATSGAVAPVRRPRGGGPEPRSPADWAPFPSDGRDVWLVGFLDGTSRLAVGLRDRSKSPFLLSWRIEGGALGSPKPRLDALPGERLVALGRHHQRVRTVTFTPNGTFRLWNNATPAPPAAPEGGVGRILSAGALALFTDGEGRAYTVGPRNTLAVLALQDVRPIRRGGDLLVVAHNAGGIGLFRLRPQTVADGRVVSPADLVARLPGEPGHVALGGPTQDGSSRLVLTRARFGDVHALRIDVMPTGEPKVVELPLVQPELGPMDRVLGAMWDRGVVRPVTWSLTGGIRLLGAPPLVPEPTPHEVAVSPDGRVAAWRTAEGFLEVWSLERGEPLLRRHGAP